MANSPESQAMIEASLVKVSVDWARYLNGLKPQQRKAGLRKLLEHFDIVYNTLAKKYID